MDQSPERPSLLERPLIRLLVAAALFGVLAGAFLAVRSTRGGGAEGPTLAGAPTPVGSPISEEGLGPLDSQVPVRGQPAPDFVLRDVDGNLVKLSDLRGSVVWINFWATWCTPCKKELPAIQKLYDEKRDEGLVVLAIDWQESAAKANEYFTSHGLTLPLLIDSGGVFDQYKLRGLPNSFFVDRQGRLVSLHWGPLNEKQARERLTDAGLP